MLRKSLLHDCGKVERTFSRSGVFAHYGRRAQQPSVSSAWEANGVGKGFDTLRNTASLAGTFPMTILKTSAAKVANL